MAEVSFEEARRCPRCDQAGEIVSTRPSRDNDGNPCKVHILRCQNPRCSWFETDWVVQQLTDGTVPVREGMERKTFPAIPGMTQEKAQEQLKELTKGEENTRRRT